MRDGTNEGLKERREMRADIEHARAFFSGSTVLFFFPSFLVCSHLGSILHSLLFLPTFLLPNFHCRLSAGSSHVFLFFTSYGPMLFLCERPFFSHTAVHTFLLSSLPHSFILSLPLVVLSFTQSPAFLFFTALLHGPAGPVLHASFLWFSVLILLSNLFFAGSPVAFAGSPLVTSLTGGCSFLVLFLSLQPPVILGCSFIPAAARFPSSFFQLFFCPHGARLAVDGLSLLSRLSFIISASAVKEE